jgi:hypothetical protein
MLETHIMVSLLIFHLVLLLVLHLVSFMDLTIAYMVLVHERIALCLDALVTAHVLIVVIVPRVGTIFLLEGFTLALSQDTWMVHIFLIVIHVPLAQMVRCKRLRRPPQVTTLSVGFLSFTSLTCHTRFLCQNQVLIICMTQEQ